MTQLETKTPKKSHLRLELSILAIVFVFQGFFTGFLAFAGDLTPNSVIKLTNAERENSGLKPLTENAALSKAAKLKAEDMLKNDYFAHNSPKGTTPWHWMKQAGYKYQYAGENLAINFETASAEHKAWMKSKTHRENILNSHYQEIGVAVTEGKINGKSSTITVQLFGTPLAAAAKKPEPAPVVMEPAPIPAEVKGVESEAVPELIVTNASTMVALEATGPRAVLERIQSALLFHNNILSQSVWIAAALVLFATILSAPLLVLHEAGKEFLAWYKQRHATGSSQPV